MTTSLAAKIDAFRKSIADITTELTGLRDQRKQFAYAAASGDAKAAKQITDLDFAADALNRQAQTVSAALETAEALLKQEQLDKEAAEARKKQVEAYQLARALIAYNEEVDLELTKLSDMFARRAATLAALGQTGVVDLSLIMRHSHKSGPTASAQLAGLSKYLALEMTPASAVRPLASTAEVLLGIGQAPDDKPARKANGAGK